MGRHDIALSDRFDILKSPVLLSGTQALVRLMLAQAARDRAAGLATAGYVTGYRGSPLGAVDMQLRRAQSQLDAAQIRFLEGLNEDLAATALWGSQQAELRGEGRHDGVFGLWYGKGPGVDRSGDVFRHANMAGTSPHGGVLVAMGDDHTGESSTVLQQSDWALVDACIPVLSPAGVQEILDYGHYGYALSRFAGLWVGLKTLKEVAEASSIVDGDPHRLQFVTPDIALPDGGLNIRLIDTPVAQEARMFDHKRRAAEAFARANRIDKRVHGAPGARIGLVAAGKTWADMAHALSLLAIDGAEAERLGVTTYKIGQSFPLDRASFHEWAEGLDLIVVVEEKRKLLETQIKDALFDDPHRPRVYGEHKGAQQRDGRPVELFPARYALDPVMIAERLGEVLIEEGRGTDSLRAALTHLAQRAEPAPDLATRLPYFCAGCPHNSSTRIPDGHRAYAGIGCHYLVQWMDRETTGFTHMGGEGANWIGEAPFSTRAHVFQNIGDGTYNHSGVQAIRAALAAGTPITYKILFNDAVAMTGGQKNDGGLTPDQIAHELAAMGVGRIDVVFDEKEEPQRADYPPRIGWHPRADMDAVQRACAEHDGVSAIIYVQTCAAEKRRRRKRGAFPDPDTRVYINPDICEGCGDCGVQSNCVAIVPLETEFGRKRAIDQSACNKDFSCLNGFCPSFVTLEGARPRKSATQSVDLPDLPAPDLPQINGTHNIVITGVGGTGVVTIGAILAQAAQIDGKGAGMIEMAGLAQKGGAVHIHCRIANAPEDISAIRVAVGEAHCIIGGDLVVSAGSGTLGQMRKGQTGAAINAHEIMTGAFTRDPEFRLPTADLQSALRDRLGDRLHLFDYTELARQLLGDSLFSNMMVLGAAWQMGLVPLSEDAILHAIMLNGAVPDQNARAFALGRWSVAEPDAAARALTGDVVQKPCSPEEKIAQREAHLAAYQSQRLVKRFRKLVDRAPDPELRLAIARGYHKLLTYKDEYEVARLHLDSLAQARATFEGDITPHFHLAPPLLSRKGPDGRPMKRRFGPWILRVFRLLALLKPLRGTPLDPFGHTAERRMERRLIREYEQLINSLLPQITPENHAIAVELAELPLQIRGFGPVKHANVTAAARRRSELLAAFNEAQKSATLAAQ